MNKEQLQYLLEQWVDRTATPEEERQLAARLEQHRDDGTVPELLVQLLDYIAADEVLPMEDRARRLSAILEIDKTISIYNKANGRKAIRPMNRPNHPLRTSFRRWGWVVAAVLLLLAEGAVVVLAINAQR
jgi:hypothetical protein